MVIKYGKYCFVGFVELGESYDVMISFVGMF